MRDIARDSGGTGRDSPEGRKAFNLVLWSPELREPHDGHPRASVISWSAEADARETYRTVPRHAQPCQGRPRRPERRLDPNAANTALQQHLTCAASNG